MLGILHFSDIHNNHKAVDDVISLSKHFINDFIAITGDVCSIKNPLPSDKYDALPNPKIWLVRGNHDTDPKKQFSHLRKVIWQAPYYSQMSDNIVVLGLDSEEREIEEQLEQEQYDGDRLKQRTIVILYHRPYSIAIIGSLLGRLKAQFPNLVSAILLHGHEHYEENFYAKNTNWELLGIKIFISHVYSANINFGKGKMLGCANRFLIEDDGKVTTLGAVFLQIVNPKAKNMGMCLACHRKMRYDQFYDHFLVYRHKLSEGENQNKDLLWDGNGRIELKNQFETSSKLEPIDIQSEIDKIRKKPVVTQESQGYDLKSAIANAFNISTNSEGWVRLAELGENLRIVDPSFKDSIYGHKKLKNLVNSLEDVFEIGMDDNQVLFVRLKK